MHIYAVAINMADWPLFNVKLSVFLAHLTWLGGFWPVLPNISDYKWVITFVTNNCNNWWMRSCTIYNFSFINEMVAILENIIRTNSHRSGRWPLKQVLAGSHFLNATVATKAVRFYDSQILNISAWPFLMLDFLYGNIYHCINAVIIYFD